MTERREIVPSWLYREGAFLPAASNDRRALATGLDCFCRHYQSAESVTQWRARTRLTVLPANASHNGP